MTTTTDFQLLWHTVSIDTRNAAPDASVRLRYLSNDARHGFAPAASMSYTIDSSSSGHRITEDGDPLATVDDVDQVLDVVYRRVHQRAFELASLRGWVRLHAATVDLPSGRLLVTARSGTGKTTLSCALRLAGIDVPADESVLVRDGVAIPVARKFHVKSSMLDVLPELGRVVDGVPRLEAAGIAAVDPRLLGGDWSIERRPVAACVVLERASRTELTRVASIEALPLLVEGSFRNQETLSAIFRTISSVARHASCHRLRLARPGEALAHLTTI